MTMESLPQKFYSMKTCDSCHVKPESFFKLSCFHNFCLYCISKDIRNNYEKTMQLVKNSTVGCLQCNKQNYMNKQMKKVAEDALEYKFPNNEEIQQIFLTQLPLINYWFIIEKNKYLTDSQVAEDDLEFNQLKQKVGDGVIFMKNTPNLEEEVFQHISQCTTHLQMPFLSSTASEVDNFQIAGNSNQKIPIDDMYPSPHSTASHMKRDMFDMYLEPTKLPQEFTVDPDELAKKNRHVYNSLIDRTEKNSVNSYNSYTNKKNNANNMNKDNCEDFGQNNMISYSVRSKEDREYHQYLYPEIMYGSNITGNNNKFVSSVMISSTNENFVNTDEIYSNAISRQNIQQRGIQSGPIGHKSHRGVNTELGDKDKYGMSLKVSTDSVKQQSEQSPSGNNVEVAFKKVENGSSQMNFEDFISVGTRALIKEQSQSNIHTKVQTPQTTTQKNMITITSPSSYSQNFHMEDTQKIIISGNIDDNIVCIRKKLNSHRKKNQISNKGQIEIRLSSNNKGLDSDDEESQADQRSQDLESDQEYEDEIIEDYDKLNEDSNYINLEREDCGDPGEQNSNIKIMNGRNSNNKKSKQGLLEKELNDKYNVFHGKRFSQDVMAGRKNQFFGHSNTAGYDKLPESYNNVAPNKKNTYSFFRYKSEHDDNPQIKKQPGRPKSGQIYIAPTASDTRKNFFRKYSGSKRQHFSEYDSKTQKDGLVAHEFQPNPNNISKNLYNGRLSNIEENGQTGGETSHTYETTGPCQNKEPWKLNTDIGYEETTEDDPNELRKEIANSNKALEKIVEKNMKKNRDLRNFQKNASAHKLATKVSEVGGVGLVKENAYSLIDKNKNKTETTDSRFTNEYEIVDNKSQGNYKPVISSTKGGMFSGLRYSTEKKDSNDYLISKKPIMSSYSQSNEKFNDQTLQSRSIANGPVLNQTKANNNFLREHRRQSSNLVNYDFQDNDVSSFAKHLRENSSYLLNNKRNILSIANDKYMAIEAISRDDQTQNTDETGKFHKNYNFLKAKNSHYNNNTKTGADKMSMHSSFYSEKQKHLNKLNERNKLIKDIKEKLDPYHCSNYKSTITCDKSEKDSSAIKTDTYYAGKGKDGCYNGNFSNTLDVIKNNLDTKINELHLSKVTRRTSHSLNVSRCGSSTPIRRMENLDNPVIINNFIKNQNLNFVGTSSINIDSGNQFYDKKRQNTSNSTLQTISCSVTNDLLKKNQKKFISGINSSDQQTIPHQTIPDNLTNDKITELEDSIKKKQSISDSVNKFFYNRGSSTCDRGKYLEKKRNHQKSTLGHNKVEASPNSDKKNKDYLLDYVQKDRKQLEEDIINKKELLLLKFKSKSKKALSKDQYNTATKSFKFEEVTRHNDQKKLDDKMNRLSVSPVRGKRKTRQSNTNTAICQLAGEEKINSLIKYTHHAHDVSNHFTNKRFENGWESEGGSSTKPKYIYDQTLNQE